MKSLIIEINDTKRIGELVTAGKIFGSTPDILVIGKGAVKGSFANAYQIDEIIPGNTVEAVADLIKDKSYEIILLSATTAGSEIAGRLSVKLKAPVITEVTTILSDMTVKRPIYGGKAVSDIKIKKTPAILTIRRKYFQCEVLEGQTTAVSLENNINKVTYIAEHEVKSEGIPLEDAEVIISGGRGIGEKDNFKMLFQLASYFNGAVGASRGAVDEGLASPTMQVGQTGNIVAPSVYFAVGISGASQHLAGIANAKCVVAINKDSEANIFKRATFGIVSDFKKIIPPLIKILEEEK
jgi:electron transfer flavoprotein alpha subunit